MKLEFESQCLSKALRANSLEAVRRALVEDPQAAARPMPCSQLPPVVAAIRYACSPQVLCVLLQSGADADAISSEGWTPLDLIARVRIATPRVASLPGKFQMPQMFPAGVTMLGAGGAVSIFTAAQMSEERCCAYAALLLNFGADAERVDAEGLTCADHAAKNGRFELAHLLANFARASADALRSLCGAAARGLAEVTAAGPTPSVRLLPQAVIERICDMLAPVPPCAWPPPEAPMSPWPPKLAAS